MGFDLLFALVSILIITLLIVVHEFGHFLAAKHYGFQTPAFGIGLPFGPSIDLFKKWGTQFKFHWLLIGGYVSIPELGDETNSEMVKQMKLKKPLQSFPVGQRAVVASGGIVFNILFAFLLTLGLAATVGMPTAVPDNRIVDFVQENPIAKSAGIIANDKIIAVNGAEVNDGDELKEAIQNAKGKASILTIERPIIQEGEEVTEEVPATFSFNDDRGEVELKTVKLTPSKDGTIGVMLAYKQSYNKLPANPFIWVWESLKFTFLTLSSMLITVWGLFVGLIQKILSIIIPVPESTAQLDQVKGIVGIIEIISKDIQNNWLMVYQFAILLSLNLAVINLLPIPALDGGHLLFMAYEGIAGKKVSEKFQETSVQFGFLFLLTIIAITTINDVKHWVFG